MKTNSTTQAPIILVGGGTGGHIMPLIAIGEELISRQQPFIYVGSPNSREEEIVRQLGWPFTPIEAGKWRRYWNFRSITQNLADGVRVIIGLTQSVRLLKQTKAKLVISKGGYVALPMVYAARLLGRKLIIHESDAVMGATNRLAAKFANQVLTAFSPSVYPNAHSRFTQVGIPIRRSLRQAAKLKSPSKSRPLVLVIGGIQGARAINSLLKPIISELVDFCDVVHSTGADDIATFTSLKKELNAAKGNHYRPFAFIDRELPYYYQSADLVVTRASATTLAEAATFKKAIYLIPLPNAAGNHQVINANKLEQAGAAVVADQQKLSSERLFSDIQQLLEEPSKITQLGEALHRYFNADETLTKIMAIVDEQTE